MDRMLRFVVSILMIFLLTYEANALTITSPKEGDTIYAGVDITVKVKADSGETWETVAFGYYPMIYNIFTNEYSYTFKLPAHITGKYEGIIVIGVDKTGKEVWLKRTLFVKLPPNVVLKGILAGESGDNFISLRKMPRESSALDIERFETSQITTHGQYSDGVNRIMTSSASGTTYTSSNEKVVTVDKEGKVTVQDIGKAVITVRNGNFSATVDVVVKPYMK